MKTFLVVEEQGGGCDYTIGCGVRTYTVKAESYEVLMAEVISFLNTTDQDYMDENELAYALAYTGESQRSDVTIYEVAVEHSLNLGTFREIVEARKQAAAATAKEGEEKAELERLKAIYE